MGEIKQRSSGLVAEKSNGELASKENDENLNPEAKAYKWEIVWLSVAKIALIHLLFLVAIPLVPFAKNATILFSYSLVLVAILGIQIGAHRLWTHRTFKANFPLRLIFAICQTISLQNDIYEWARDHRVHHKWSDTDADPHNSNRGFFFSHMGWLMVKKHPEVLKKGATLDLSDLEADPIVRWQRKPLYVYLWVPIFWGLLPTLIPVLGWGESPVLSFFLCGPLRYVLSLHVTWLVNSWAHMYGNRPYNKELVPVEASIRHLLQGEGFHNYHHAFPWDYSTSELGPADVFNPATAIIDFFAYMGWAWDLRKPDRSAIEKTIESKGEPEARKYERGHGVREWAGGLAVLTFPIWFFLTYKYVVLYFYFQAFDTLPNFDLVNLLPFTKFLVLELPKIAYDIAV